MQGSDTLLRSEPPAN